MVWGKARETLQLLTQRGPPYRRFDRFDGQRYANFAASFPPQFSRHARVFSWEAV
jgi:hypothetical protein